MRSTPSFASEPRHRVGPTIEHRCAATLAIGFALLAPLPAAGAEPVAAGQYGDLMLGVDPASGTITGFARADTVGNGTEKAPQFSCMFALRGTPLARGGYDIVAWSPGDKAGISGHLKSKGSTLSIVLARQPDGCQYRFVDEAADFDLEARRTWQAVRLVGTKQAFFHTGPDIHDREKAFVVYGDPLGVVSTDGDWSVVEYLHKGRLTRAWIPAADLSKDEPVAASHNLAPDP